MASYSLPHKLHASANGSVALALVDGDGQNPWEIRKMSTDLDLLKRGFASECARHEAVGRSTQWKDFNPVNHKELDSVRVGNLALFCRDFGVSSLSNAGSRVFLRTGKARSVCILLDLRQSGIDKATPVCARFPFARPLREKAGRHPHEGAARGENLGGVSERSPHLAGMETVIVRSHWETVVERKKREPTAGMAAPRARKGRPLGLSRSWIKQAVGHPRPHRRNRVAASLLMKCQRLSPFQERKVTIPLK
jgi:hypothetical protein